MYRSALALPEMPEERPEGLACHICESTIYRVFSWSFHDCLVNTDNFNTNGVF